MRMARSWRPGSAAILRYEATLVVAAHNVMCWTYLPLHTKSPRCGPPQETAVVVPLRGSSTDAAGIAQWFDAFAGGDLAAHSASVALGREDQLAHPLAHAAGGS